MTVSVSFKAIIGNTLSIRARQVLSPARAALVYFAKRLMMWQNVGV